MVTLNKIYTKTGDEGLTSLGDGSRISKNNIRVDNIDSIDELVSAESLICCVPTWNTGADEARSGTAWDDLVQEIPDKDFAGQDQPSVSGASEDTRYFPHPCIL